MNRKLNTVAWDMSNMVEELKRLTKHEVIGTYQSFEITEILGFMRQAPKSQPPVNLLTLAVAEPITPPLQEASKCRFLNKNPLPLPNTDWKVGVVQYRVSMQALFDAITRYLQTEEWRVGESSLQIGTLAAVPPQFVPADSHIEHPWNQILKNNFWEGSHVLELFDTSKTNLQFLTRDTRVLTKLGELIRPYVPLALDGMSDRLGNILVQLPVTVIATGVRRTTDSDHTVVVAWHPRVEPRAVRVSSEIYEDFTIDAYDSTDVITGGTPQSLHSPGGGARTSVWDNENRVLLGATAPTAFITSVAMSMHPIFSGQQPATRQFLLPKPKGVLEQHSIIIRPINHPHIIGSTPERPREPWRNARIFAQSLTALEERKEFIQYGKPGAKGRTDAIEDIRWLIEKHGTSGVWLWDPYLNADDVLRTLFFCPHECAELRALTAGAQPPRDSGESDHLSFSKSESGWVSLKRWLLSLRQRHHLCKTPIQSWEEKQAARLDATKGNCQALNLEFRIRKGSAGWAFHDRFIIFPNGEGPATAWSLGTSVNSLGRQHHILQKVSNGQLIANAFVDLWDKLKTPDCVIWKSR